MMDSRESSPNAGSPMVGSYLALLSAVADCVGAACPAVGTPYRHRLERLRTRLEYDLDDEPPEAEFMQEVSSGVRVQLADFSRQAAVYQDRHDVELRRIIEDLFESVAALGSKQEFYCDQLRRVARPTENGDPAQLGTEVLNSIDSLRFDWQSLLTKMRSQLAEAERRIAQTATADPVTGLMNRREMERHLSVETFEGRVPTTILFTFDAGLPDEVIQQVAMRLISQFRPNDLIGRWSGNEFLILFRSTPEIAAARTAQILPWVQGRYLAGNGDLIEVHAEGALMEKEVAP
jgi:hypothetical protein